MCKYIRENLAGVKLEHSKFGVSESWWGWDIGYYKMRLDGLPKARQ